MSNQHTDGFTDREINKLIELNGKGLGPKEISNYFPDRTYTSIRTKLINMRLGMKSKETKILSFVSGEENNKQSKLELLLEANRPSVVEIPTDKFFGERIRFGAIADTHLGSKYERLDALNNFYDILLKEGIKVVYHGGNYVDGEFYYNKYEVYIHGFDDMIKNFLKKYPKREGIETYFITGDDHSGWWMQREGIDPGKIIQERQTEFDRNDLHYLGYQEADIILKAKNGQVVMKLMHAGGGTAYADSYSTQRMVEAFQEGEKPAVLLVGHYHKAVYHFPRGVHVLQLGTFQDQTRFMRKNKIKAHVGGWIVELNQGPTGEINRFKPEFINYYDRGFYIKHEHKNG